MNTENRKSKIENMFLRDILTATIKIMRFKHLGRTAMIQAELFQGNQICKVVLSIMLNSFPSMSLSIVVEQKVDQYNSLLICLRHLHFYGMAAGFLSYHWIFYRHA